MAWIPKHSGNRARIRIAAGPLVAEIVPSLGGGVARFDVIRGEQKIEVFRAWPEGMDDPNLLGLYVLVPWSNRISGGGFRFAGAFHPLLPNAPGEPCPIHGDGWLSSWSVSSNRDRSVKLERAAGGPGPFRYGAVLEYMLEPARLTINLEAINLAGIALPFGIGFHPWFPRTPATRLLATAKSVRLEDERHLPTERVAVAS